MTEDQPQFCPWCGSPMGFSEHAHEPRFELLLTQAQAQGPEPSIPPRIEALMTGESYVGACQGCRIVSHVISHRAGGSS